ERRQPALVAGPLRQCLSAVFAFQVERRRLEVPVDQADEIVALAQGVAQQPRQRGLALDRGEPFAVEAELEHPRLAAARLPRQPHFAAQGPRQRAVEQEMLPPRDRLAGFELERAGGLLANRGPLELAVEAVADPRHSDDPRLA